MVFEEPVVEFIAVDQTSVLVTSAPGVTTCDGPADYMNNCAHFNIDGGYLYHNGNHDGKCSDYTVGDMDD